MNLKNICLTLSLIGILILLLIINTSEPKEMNISDINPSHLEKQVKITGQVTGISAYQNNFTVITLEQDNHQIDITCNCPDIEKNQTITAIGKVEKYKSQLQVSASQLRLHVG